MIIYLISDQSIRQMQESQQNSHRLVKGAVSIFGNRNEYENIDGHSHRNRRTELRRTWVLSLENPWRRYICGPLSVWRLYFILSSEFLSKLSTGSRFPSFQNNRSPRQTDRQPKPILFSYYAFYSQFRLIYGLVMLNYNSSQCLISNSKCLISNISSFELESKGISDPCSDFNCDKKCKSRSQTTAPQL